MSDDTDVTKDPYTVAVQDNVIQLRGHKQPSTPFAISFSDDDSKIIAQLTVKDNVMTFEGEADAAAKIFFDSIIDRWDASIVKMKDELETVNASRERLRNALNLIATGMGDELKMVAGLISNISEDM